MNKVKWSFIVFSVVFLFSWFVSPYWVVYQIQQAVDHNQPGKISRYIDFPAVRSSLQPQVEAMLNQKLGTDQPDNFIEKFGARLNEQFSKQLVEQIVTPDGVVFLMQGKTLTEGLQDSLALGKNAVLTELRIRDQSQPANLSESTKTTVNSPQFHASYPSFNRFVIQIPAHPGTFTEFELKRDGLSWNIVAIHLPKVS
jgi:hypothetical protein